MAIQRLNGKTVFNPLEYSNKHISGNATASATINTWTTLLNISGKGALFKAMIAANYAYKRKIRITVDGVVVFFGSCLAPSSSWTAAIGILQSSDVVAGGNNTTATVPVSQIHTSMHGIQNNGQYPLATEQDGGTNPITVALSQAIEFKSSLVIEIQSNQTSDIISYDINYAI